MNNNADNKPGVMIYFDIIPLIEEMNPENAGQLFLAILKYAQYGEVPSLSGLARSVWPFIKSLVDRDSRRYDIARKKNNGRPTAGMQSVGVKNISILIYG